MGQIVSPKKSVRNTREERSSRIIRGGSLKSRESELLVKRGFLLLNAASLQ
jgi:hypothetical protein